MTITKLTPEDAGCYVDGHWGQYAVAHMVARAEEFGFEDTGLSDLADRKLAEMRHWAEGEYLTDDEYSILIDASNEVEAWLNENVAPEGFSFGWWEGEFYLWADEEWNEAP